MCTLLWLTGVGPCPNSTLPDDDADHGRGLVIVKCVSEQWGTNVPVYTGCRAQLIYVLILLAVAAFVVSAIAGHR
jgi:hypothetical protein